MAARRAGGEPCRIMARSSGSAMERAAARGAAANGRRPRSRPSATAARARRSRFRRLFGHVVFGRRCSRQQPPGKRQVVFVGSAGEQAIAADAVKALRQHVEQEAA